MNNTFGKPIIPDNEDERLAKLRSLNILNTYEEEGPFKHIVSIASRMFDVPIALVNFVDMDYVVTRAGVGVDGENRISRGTSLCSLSILRQETTVFEDACDDPCLLANPLVVGDFGLRFYAGAPLVTSDGYSIGAVCIVDKEPREFSESDRKMLESLASAVMDEIEKK